MKKLHSLRVAILAVIIPIIAAALALSSIYAYSTARKITETTINDEIKAGLQVALERIDKSLQKNAKVSQALAKGVEAAYPTASESYYENLLTGIIATNDETFGGGIWFEPYAFQKSQQYFSPYCMRVDGKVTYQDGYNLGEGVYYTDQDWYTNVNSSSGSVWSAPYYDDFAKVSMVTSSSPILDSTGALIGVATTDIDLTQIQEVVNQLRVNGMGRAFLIDTEGTYVGDEDSSKLLNKKIQEEENSSFASLGQQMLTQNTGSGSYKDGNETYFVQYAPVEGSPLIAAVVLSETDMYGQVYQLRVQMAAFSIVITILLSLFIVLYLSKAVVRPLNKLAKSTQAIADGNLDVSVDCTSNNEIGVISHALQSTITRLSQYIAYIEEISAVLNKVPPALSTPLPLTYEGF